MSWPGGCSVAVLNVFSMVHACRACGSQLPTQSAAGRCALQSSHGAGAAWVCKRKGLACALGGGLAEKPGQLQCRR